MRNNEGLSIDWDGVAKRAREMSVTEIHATLNEINKTLPSADACDRALGTDRGGRYRDECSVLRDELKRRHTAPKPDDADALAVIFTDWELAILQGALLLAVSKWSDELPDDPSLFEFTPPPGADRIEAVPVTER